MGNEKWGMGNGEWRMGVERTLKIEDLEVNTKYEVEVLVCNKQSTEMTSLLTKKVRG